MRITFILPCDAVSGGARVLAAHADRLRRRGHEIAVVLPPPSRPAARDALRRFIRNTPATESRAQQSYLHQLGLDYHFAARPGTVSDADLPDADVVVATWWETAEWISGLSPQKGTKVYFIQGYETDVYSRWWHRRFRMRLEQTWRLPMHKIVVSQWLRDIAQVRYGDNSVTLVPNGVDPDQFNAPPRNKQLRSTVGFLYSPSPCKGCDRMLRAIEIARDTIPHLRVVAFGANRPDRRLPLPDYIEFSANPAQHVIPRIYAQCDAWLFGSRAEGFGLPILEAMACRTPVIATSAGAAPELLAPGGGISIDSGDPQQMSDAIIQISHMPPSDWQRMSDAAQATAEQYSWEGATTRFERALIQATSAPTND